ncbi:MAG: tRNA (guanosine(37)-N1)-methyltransferase TrmD [Gammaproteobacteria bacterium]|nr:tRNA (guanosine(37)-N1)-methyltransferase TrmD [Gammaproteobacteria bacterium]NVK87920.1 tRNA (guanosine(37)-N1)-methyltransferase TrmD [Gammaproteobacteria bacterium]
MNVCCVSLFPEMFAAITEYGVSGRAVRAQQVAVTVINPRDFTTDKHRTVDDRPYGGGPGMLMKVEPLAKAIGAAKQQLLSQHSQQPYVVYLSPQGKRLTQSDVSRLRQKQNLVLVAGRYEGIDERLIESQVDEEISIGDFVLSGGELPAMTLIDAMIRTVPGVLGHADSATEDSFADGLLDCPHYTRPEQLAGKEVPTVLLSGDHERIRRWRLKQALGRTWLRRPDLLEGRTLTAEQAELLQQFKQELQQN